MNGALIHLPPFASVASDVLVIQHMNGNYLINNINATLTGSIPLCGQLELAVATVMVQVQWRWK